MRSARAGGLVATAVAAGLLAAPGISAQTKARAPATHDCGSGVSIRLSAPAASQGGLLEAELRSAAPLVEVKADWAGHEISFWQAAKSKNLQRALLGVDLEREPGNYDLKLDAQLPGGKAVACAVVVAVKAGKFPIEKLTVDKQFVEPSPQDAERAEKEGQRLHEIYARVTPERLWQGNFRLPLNGARNAKNFGRQRVLNGQPRSPHSGVDLPASAGTPVHAAQRGRVVLAENLFYAGNTVVIDHGLGVYTLYAHMESLAVAEGDSVQAGANLGRVGATGRVTGPHLHWGLIVDQARVNALQILSLPLS
ncbi:MAG: M23 family metallopeptidase [Candidatus Acidiferrales bacterium]